jgi:uncharacterized membrane protein YccF (DUF307 family)
MVQVLGISFLFLFFTVTSCVKFQNFALGEVISNASPFDLPWNSDALSVVEYAVDFSNVQDVVLNNREIDAEQQYKYYLWVDSYVKCSSGLDFPVRLSPIDFFERVEDKIPLNGKYFVVKSDSSCSFIYPVERLIADDSSMRFSSQDLNRLNNFFHSVKVLSTSWKTGALSPLKFQLWKKKLDEGSMNYPEQVSTFDLTDETSDLIQQCSLSPGKLKRETCKMKDVTISSIDKSSQIFFRVNVYKTLISAFASILITTLSVLAASYLASVIEIFYFHKLRGSGWTSAKYLLGNLFYLSSGGIFAFLLHLIFSFMFILSIAGFQIGIQKLKISTNWLCPYGRSAKSFQSLTDDLSFLSKTKRNTMEMLWTLLAGCPIFIVHMFLAFVLSGLLCIPTAKMHFRKAIEALNPHLSIIELEEDSFNYSSTFKMFSPKPNGKVSISKKNTCSLDSVIPDPKLPLNQNQDA